MDCIQQAHGKSWSLYNGDCCQLIAGIPDNTIDFCIHSPPFSTLYIYSDSEADMGNCADNDEFFRHYSFLIGELHRVTVPGRLCAVHCKDLPKYLNRDGEAGLIDFPGMIVQEFEDAGWTYHSHVTIWKCPVTERERTNNHGLLHKTVMKDSSGLRQGMADYLLVFRKPSGTMLSDKPIERKRGFDRFIGNERFHPLVSSYHPSPYARTGTRGLGELDISSGGDDLLTEAQLLDRDINKSIIIWRRYAEPVWWDIDQTNVLNYKIAKDDKDEKHICLARGSLILTKERGLVPIQEVEVGEHTLTHLGRWRPIIAKQKTADSADVVSVRCQGVHSLVCTPTHKLWARIAPKGDTRKRRAKKAKPEWIESHDVDGCYLNLKLPPTEKSVNDLGLWWTVGRWIADGHWNHQRKSLHISIGKAKLQESLDQLGEFAGTMQDLGSSVQVRIHDRGGLLRSIVSQCGESADTKRLPAVAFTLQQPQAYYLLKGYLSGDGYFDEKRNRWSISTVSRELAVGLQFLIQRAFGTVATIQAGRPERKGVIEGREVNCKQEWAVSFNVSGYTFGFIADDGAWKPVKSVTDAGRAETWNIRVLEDESYTAEGVIVKNCPLQCDLIERAIQLWTNPGDTVLTPFAGIGSEVVGAVKLGRKGVGFELKGEYFKHATANCKIAEADASRPTLFDDVGGVTPIDITAIDQSAYTDHVNSVNREKVVEYIKGQPHSLPDDGEQEAVGSLAELDI